MASKVILGIDPGTILMGYGVISVEGRHPQLEAMGLLRLDRFVSHYDRLLKIMEGVEALIKRYQPEVVALEAPFYGKNVQSMLKLGRAQGVAMVAALQQGRAVVEYSPSTIKKAITGSGSASKEQVADLVKRMLRISSEAMMEHYDATDGVAVALTHYIHESNPLRSAKSMSWKEYAERNAHKVK